MIEQGNNVKIEYEGSFGFKLKVLEVLDSK